MKKRAYEDLYLSKPPSRARTILAYLGFAVHNFFVLLLCWIVAAALAQLAFGVVMILAPQDEIGTFLAAIATVALFILTLFFSFRRLRPRWNAR